MRSFASARAIQIVDLNSTATSSTQLVLCENLARSSTVDCNPHGRRAKPQFDRVSNSHFKLALSVINPLSVALFGVRSLAVHAFTL